MKEKDLGAFEAQVFRTYWDDGLLDLLSGVALLAIGIGWHFDQAVLSAIAPALLVTLWKPLRSRFVDPRLGYVEFTEGRRRQNRRSLVLMNLLGVLSLLAGVLVFLWAREMPNREMVALLVPALPAALVALGGIIAALALTLMRFVYYSAALLLLAVLTMVLEWRPGVPMAAGGLLITLSGLFLLFRFLKGNPVTSEEIDA